MQPRQSQPAAEGGFQPAHRQRIIVKKQHYPRARKQKRQRNRQARLLMDFDHLQPQTPEPQ
jgi:hypothetical protein